MLSIAKNALIVFILGFVTLSQPATAGGEPPARPVRGGYGLYGGYIVQIVDVFPDGRATLRYPYYRNMFNWPDTGVYPIRDVSKVSPQVASYRGFGKGDLYITFDGHSRPIENPIAMVFANGQFKYAAGAWLATGSLDEGIAAKVIYHPGEVPEFEVQDGFDPYDQMYSDADFFNLGR